MQTDRATFDRAIKVLRENAKTSKDLDLVIALINISIDKKNSSDTIDLIDRNAYFVANLWSKEDICDVCRKSGIEPTEETVDEILYILQESFTMDDCESGWASIQSAVNLYTKNSQAMTR